MAWYRENNNTINSKQWQRQYQLINDTCWGDEIRVPWNKGSASWQTMGADLEAKEEWTNGRRGAGRDQETVISQEEVQGVFPINPVKIPSHFTSWPLLLSLSLCLATSRANTGFKVLTSNRLSAGWADRFILTHTLPSLSMPPSRTWWRGWMVLGMLGTIPWRTTCICATLCSSLGCRPHVIWQIGTGAFQRGTRSLTVDPPPTPSVYWLCHHPPPSPSHYYFHNFLRLQDIKSTSLELHSIAQSLRLDSHEHTFSRPSLHFVLSCDGPDHHLRLWQFLAVWPRDLCLTQSPSCSDLFLSARLWLPDISPFILILDPHDLLFHFMFPFTFPSSYSHSSYTHKFISLRLSQISNPPLFLSNSSHPLFPLSGMLPRTPFRPYWLIWLVDRLWPVDINVTVLGTWNLRSGQPPLFPSSQVQFQVREVLSSCLYLCLSSFSSL